MVSIRPKPVDSRPAAVAFRDELTGRRPSNHLVIWICASLAICYPNSKQDIFRYSRACTSHNILFAFAMEGRPSKRVACGGSGSY